MTDVIKKGLLTLMSDKCYDNYFVDFNFMHVECFKALLSKCLGLGIIAGSILVKVPQIVKIWIAKSAEGISLFSVFLDLFCITLHMSYNYVSGFPFSSWGDTSFLAIQTAIIGFLALTFNGSQGKAVAFAIGYSILCFILMGGMTPLEFLWSAQGFNIPLLMIGKLSQALANYKNGSTGQLSAITCFMLFFGSLARIFTSVQETGDTMMIITYIASTSANAVIVLQMLYYWNVDNVKTDQTTKPKQRSKKVD